MEFYYFKLFYKTEHNKINYIFNYSLKILNIKFILSSHHDPSNYNVGNTFACEVGRKIPERPTAAGPLRSLFDNPHFFDNVGDTFNLTVHFF